jgi:hypothetical protein
MQRRNMSTRDVGRNTAPGRFDFGKFGHDMKLDRRPGTRCAVRPGGPRTIAHSETAKRNRFHWRKHAMTPTRRACAALDCHRL